MRRAFVGERRSPLAVRRGWTWESGHLAAKPLFRALTSIGLDPREQTFLNLWADDGTPVPEALIQLAELAQNDVQLVALGRKVARELNRAGLPHVRLVHPAARGVVRETSTYQTLVAQALDLGDPDK